MMIVINKLDFKDPAFGKIWTEFDEMFLNVPQSLEGYVTIYYYECEWIDKNPEFRNAIDITPCYYEEHTYTALMQLLRQPYARYFPDGTRTFTEKVHFPGL